jgi:hypothetical protein
VYLETPGGKLYENDLTIRSHQSEGGDALEEFDPGESRKLGIQWAFALCVSKRGEESPHCAWWKNNLSQTELDEVLMEPGVTLVVDDARFELRELWSYDQIRWKKALREGRAFPTGN